MKGSAWLGRKTLKQQGLLLLLPGRRLQGVMGESQAFALMGNYFRF